MSKTLALGVVLGATLSGSFGSVLGTAKSALGQLGTTVKSLEKDFKALKNEQSAFDKGKLTGPVRQIANYKQLSLALVDAKKNSEALTKSLRAHQEAKAHRENLVNNLRGTAMTGAAVAAPLVFSVKAFMDQEAAATNMKIAFMTAGGGVSDAFAVIKKQTLELGDSLPGTTADFMNLGRVLKEQGLSDDVIKNGALKSAANLNVLLGTTQEFGGEFIAKMMEARGIADKDLSAAADLVQRARYAFGMKPQDMLDSMKYDAPIANILNIKGLDKTKDMLALQGMGATTGLEGAQWGTNLRALMVRMGEGVDGVKNATKGNKAVARGQMEQAGVDFQFYDKSGKFKGPEAMVAEMEKLKVIKEKLGEKAALNVASEIFGTEAASAALIIAEKGTKGLEENRKKMDEQASLQERIKEQSQSLNSIWENITGTMVNLAASVGEIFGDDIKDGMKSANDFVSNTLKPWLADNKGLVKSIAGIGVGLLGLKLAAGGVRLLFSATFGEAYRLWNTGRNAIKVFQSLRQISQLKGGATTLGKGFEIGKKIGGKALNLTKMLGLKTLNIGKFLVFKGGAGLTSGLRLAGRGLGVVMRVGGSLARVMGGTLVKGLGMAGRAVLFLGRALLMNPIGIAVAVIAGAAYLIWKNWDKLKPWFSKMWSGIKAVFSAAFSGLKSLFFNFTPLGLVISHWNILRPYFSKLWSSVKSYAAAAWSGIKSVWSNVGAFFSGKVAQIKSFFSNLPSAFAEYGRNIIQGLIDGVTAKWEALKAKISGMASMVSGAFTSKTEIRSPSRLFARFGGYLMQGLGVGIGRETPAVLRKMGGVAQSMSASFAPKLDTPKIIAPPSKPSIGIGGLLKQVLPSLTGGGFGGLLKKVLLPLAQIPVAKVVQARVANRRDGEVTAKAGGVSASAGGDTFHFHIAQQSGESGDALAQRIMRMIEQKTGARRRAFLGDTA